MNDLKFDVGDLSEGFGESRGSKKFPSAFQAYDCKIVDVRQKEIKHGKYAGGKLILVDIINEEEGIGYWDDGTAKYSKVFIPQDPKFNQKVKSFFQDLYLSHNPDISGEELKNKRGVDFGSIVGQRVGVAFGEDYKNPQFASVAYTIPIKEIEEYNKGMLAKSEAWVEKSKKLTNDFKNGNTGSGGAAPNTGTAAGDDDLPF